MKVAKDIDRDGNICPPLHVLLESLNSETHLMHHIEHGQRHPHAIYNLSWERFKNAYQNLIIYLGNQEDIDKYNSGTELFIKTKEVIESIDSFIDDTYHIMKCFVPKSLVDKDITFADKWLEKVDPSAITDYKNNIKFAEPMHLAVNKFRHNHGEMGQIYIQAQYYGKAYGFYILSADETGTISPCQEIHKRYNGRNTAFSYNRFLLETLADFYLISAQAEKTLIRLLKGQVNYIYTYKKVSMDSSNYTNLINCLFPALTKILFDDEYDRCPQVDLVDKKLLIKNVADKTFLKRFMRPDKYTIETPIVFDGYSKTFAIPYLGD